MNFLFLSFLFLVRGIELRTSYLPSRHLQCWAKSPASHKKIFKMVNSWHLCFMKHCHMVIPKGIAEIWEHYLSDLFSLKRFGGSLNMEMLMGDGGGMGSTWVIKLYCKVHTLLSDVTCILLVWGTCLIKVSEVISHYGLTLSRFIRGGLMKQSASLFIQDKNHYC